MTVWCSSTTSVRKVRARSSDRLRVLTFGAARTSALAADDEIEVMRAPRQGDRFRCCRWEPDSARPQIPVQPTGPRWALLFFLISIVAGVLRFTGISAATADIARFLFYVFVVIFLVLLILGLTIFRV